MKAHTAVSILKDQLAQLPVVNYPGTISIINTPEQAEAALEAIFKNPVVGFDTETRPSFKKGHTNNVALMQVSNGEQCWLFRINRLGIDGAVKKFLESESVLKVGLSIKDDFFVMHRSAEFEPKNFIELQSFVKDYMISDTSLQKIYGILFGERISKGQRLSNWEADELNEAQQKYASIDAWACLKIYRHLKGGKFEPRKSPYLATIIESTEP
ncbi:MAG: 3'-5' exonuclease domain-containing protein 2 [Paramuribaculum sp.]|nr:3'-5' exonuclease domain-containing protein 2 [Paramuribaculum sp.]MDE5836479.1 3'-5' exonuclease domain-containing protein 2 [Paramuribaculum sp.]